MRRHLALLALPVVVLACVLANPSTSCAQGGFIGNLGNDRNIGGFPRYGPGGAFFGTWNGTGWQYGGPYPKWYYAPMYPGSYSAVPASGYQSLYPSMAQPVDSQHAYIHVQVPANAKVLFDNAPTKQTGPNRMFVSPQLEPNQRYTYDVTAEWTQNGQPHRESRTVRLVRGETVAVDFTPAPADRTGVR